MMSIFWLQRFLFCKRKKNSMESVLDSRAPVWSSVRNHIWEPVASAAASSTPPSSQSPEAPKKIDGKRRRSKGGIKDSSSSNTNNNNNVANGNEKRKSETSFHTIPEPQPRQVWFLSSSKDGSFFLNFDEFRIGMLTNTNDICHKPFRLIHLQEGYMNLHFKTMERQKMIPSVTVGREEFIDPLSTL